MFNKCPLNAQHIKTLTNLATFQAFCAQFHCGRAYLQGFLVSSLPFLVKYNVVITLLVHSSIFCVNLALFGSKLMEPFINKQTNTHIHIYLQHSANYSKIWSTRLGLPEFGWLKLCKRKKCLNTSKLIFFYFNKSSLKIAHPRPPSLSPRAFRARHITPLFYQKICLPNLPPKKWIPWVRAVYKVWLL